MFIDSFRTLKRINKGNYVLRNITSARVLMTHWKLTLNCAVEGAFRLIFILSRRNTKIVAKTD